MDKFTAAKGQANAAVSIMADLRLSSWRPRHELHVRVMKYWEQRIGWSLLANPSMPWQRRGQAALQGCRHWADARRWRHKHRTQDS